MSQPCFGQIYIALDSAVDFVINSAFIAQLDYRAPLNPKRVM